MLFSSFTSYSSYEFKIVTVKPNTTYHLWVAAWTQHELAGFVRRFDLRKQLCIPCQVGSGQRDQPCARLGRRTLGFARVGL